MAKNGKTKAAEPEAPKPEESTLFQAPAEEAKPEPVTEPVNPEDNKAGLEDVLAPLKAVIGTGAAVFGAFDFISSELVEGRKIAHYQFGKGGAWLSADEEGTCYAELETGYEPIPREVALADWPELMTAPKPEPEQQPETPQPETPLETAASQTAANQEPEAADADFRVFSNEEALALRDPSLGGTIDKLSMLKSQGQAMLEARIDILRRLRKASIMLTFPTDWVLFKNDQTGQEMAYLQDCGAERVQNLWGINIDNVRGPEKILGDNGAYGYIVKGDGRSRFIGGEGEHDIEGVRFSDDRFFKNHEGLRKEYYIRKSARTNMDGNILRTISGLGNVPIEELRACGIDTDRSHHGRGYGTAGERSGADVVLKDAGIPKSLYPKCNVCGGDMKFIPGRDSGEKQYEAFFACQKPKGTCEGKTVKAAGWIAKTKKEQAPSGTAEPPPNAEGWSCDNAKKAIIEKMRGGLLEKGIKPEQLQKHLEEVFPEPGIKVESLGNERAAVYITALSKKVNEVSETLAKK